MGNKESILNLKGFLLLIIFIFLKIGIAHALTHMVFDDHANDCDHCILVIDSNKNKTFIELPYSSPSLSQPIVFRSKHLKILYQNPSIVTQLFSTYFNKPPPFTFIQ